LNVYDLTLNGNVQPIEVGWTLPPQPFLGGMPDKVGFGAHNLHGAQKPFWPTPADISARAMAAVYFGRGSAGNRLVHSWHPHGRRFPAVRESSQGGFGLIEQRANQLYLCVFGRRTGPPHPGQTFPTRAAEQTKKEQLNLVIRMVGQRNGVDLHRRAVRARK